MKIGIGSWTYPWAIGVAGQPHPAVPLDAFGLLRRAADLGVGVVQFADNLPPDALLPPDLARLGADAARLGIALELGTRGVEPGHLLRYLDLARCVGAVLVRTMTHTGGSTPDLQQVGEWLREALPAYERAGVTLALENYEKHTSGELAGLVRRIDSPRLGVCLDTVNSLGALETPAEVARCLAPFTVNLHVKDFGIERVPGMMGYIVLGSPAGTGRLDIPWLLDEVARYGRYPSVIVEQWPPFTGSLETTIALEADWAERSVRYLQSHVRG